MHRPRFTLTRFFQIVLVALFTNLVFQIIYFVWIEKASLDLVDRELAVSERRLFAVVDIAERRDLSRAEMESELSRFVSVSGMKGYVQIFRDNRILYQSPNFEPGTSFRSVTRDFTAKGPITESIRSNPVRMFSKSEGPYTFVLGLPLDNSSRLQKAIHPLFSLSLAIIIFLLAVTGLVLIYVFGRPMRALRRYLTTLAGNPKVVPVPQIRGEINHDVDEVGKEIYTIVDGLHKSRDQALEFSSLASHELRTPLSIIRSQLETALSSKMTGIELRKFVGSIYDEMLRLNGIVDDLLTLSTLQAGSFRLNLDTFTMEHFLKQFYDEALFLTRPHDITVVLKKGPQVLVQADRSRLRQVFFNLLDNSIKNTSSGGRIRIGHEFSGNDVLITFADTGRGIPQEIIGNVFTPFFKQETVRTGQNGAGLGLALVKWIIENHRGKVSVESMLGKGTTFFIRIPQYQPT